MTNKVYLLLGSNLGDKKANLEQAIELIIRAAGKINQLSKIYKTAAWGKEDQPVFYNQVIVTETNLHPHELLAKLLRIEAQLGRTRFEKWGERIIDIDILFYDNRIINTTTLKVPHPEIQNRRFTLVPMAELEPEFVHPTLQKSMLKLLSVCKDKLEVLPLEDA